MRFARKLEVVRRLDSNGNSPFWTLVQKLNDLRVAAAHGDYESRRTARFREVESALRSMYPNSGWENDEELVDLVAASCFDYLKTMKDRFRKPA